jgi:hypothetical protein
MSKRVVRLGFQRASNCLFSVMVLFPARHDDTICDDCGVTKRALIGISKQALGILAFTGRAGYSETAIHTL